MLVVVVVVQRRIILDLLLVFVQVIATMTATPSTYMSSASALDMSTPPYSLFLSYDLFDDTLYPLDVKGVLAGLNGTRLNYRLPTQ